MILWPVIGLITVVYSLEPSAIRWPAGAYGLPKPTSGCPWAVKLKWKMGWRLQDTNYYEDHYKSNNSRSAEFHLDGKVNKITVNSSFCIKDDLTDKDKYRPAWPPGKYCIYKVDAHCPKGLIEGYVVWHDDEYMLFNGNEFGGTLPEGIYDWFTEIHFCCKTDGDKNDPILLPSKSPFFLLAYNSSKCQMVKWAIASVEWIYYHTSDWNNDDQRGGAYPYNAGKMHPTIYYCYYQVCGKDHYYINTDEIPGCNKTLTAESGTFLSPNYPRKYPDGQYCSWRITVNKVHKILLIFSTFSFQTEQNTDELYVHDGPNAEGEILGVFYGGHPPPREGIYSSSNTMFLIFKSDKNDSYTGFSASYYAVDNSSPSVSTTLQIPEVTPSSAVTSSPLKTPKVMSSYIGTSTTIPTSKVMLSSIVNGTMPRTPEVISPSTITCTTLQALGLTSSLTATTTCTISQTPEMTPSSTVMTLKTPEVTAASTVTSTPQLSFLTFSSSVTTTTSQTLEVKPSCTSNTLASRNLKGPLKEGFNVVPVIVPVVLVVLIAVLIAVFFYWRRKRINRGAGLNDGLYLRLRNESAASEENASL